MTRRTLVVQDFSPRDVGQWRGSKRRAPAAYLAVRSRGSRHHFDYTERGVIPIMGHPTQNQLPIPADVAAELAARILARVDKREDGCWIRTVFVDPISGYTRIHRQRDGRRTYYLAHRVLFTFAKGPIPDGYTVDHLCEVPACCNPDHLIAVPHHKNVLRSRTNFYAVNARKTHCVRGHELPPHEVGKTRRCQPCMRIRQAEYAARKREAS